MKKYWLLFAIACFGGAAFAAPIDSLRTEKIDDQLFVIHQVDPQETLFGLSRRYDVTVDEIKRFNPSLAEGLKIGDLLKIPVVIKEVPEDTQKHVVKAGETLFSISKAYEIEIDDIQSLNNLTSNTLSVGQELHIPEKKNSVDNNPTRTPVKITLPDTAEFIYHQVQQGETLYGLGQVYAVELSDLKNWNDITENALSIGDTLIVGYRKKTTATGKDIASSNPTEEPSLTPVDKAVTRPAEPATPINSVSNEPKPDETIVASADTDEVKVTREVVKNAADFDEIVETGLAELIEDSGNSKKYLALHRTAKTGTIIRVYNEMNGQEVFVRVIGPLPDTGINDKVLIKISKSAYDRLSAIDKRFRVKISYFPD